MWKKLSLWQATKNDWKEALRTIHSDTLYDVPQTSAYIPAFRKQATVYSIKACAYLFLSMLLSTYKPPAPVFTTGCYPGGTSNWLPSQQKEQVMAVRREQQWQSSNGRLSPLWQPALSSLCLSFPTCNKENTTDLHVKCFENTVSQDCLMALFEAMHNVGFGLSVSGSILCCFSSLRPIINTILETQSMSTCTSGN